MKIIANEYEPKEVFKILREWTELTQEELNQILETATSLEKAPNINSRHAIVYDRVSRSDIIWEKGK